MKTFINEWVVPSIIAVVIVLFLNRFIFILVTVPTGSMETTIMPGDRLYVNKLFDVKDAKRGDIIVFQSDELDARLVKRLIGLPGETVEINEDGETWNGFSTSTSQDQISLKFSNTLMGIRPASGNGSTLDASIEGFVNMNFGIDFFMEYN